MEFRDFTAGADDNGRRLDRILRIFLKEKSLGEIYKLLRKGLIKVNHKKAQPETHVNAGDIISIAAFLFDDKETVKVENKYDHQSLKIIFENEHLLIIDKPYGQSVHGEKVGIHKAVLNYLDSKADKNQNKSMSFRPGPLHRLDGRTTGLLVFSKSLEGARWFSDGIKNHTIHKTYIGLAQGRLENQEEWKDRLSDDDDSEGFYTVKLAGDENGKDSSTTSGALAETIARPLACGTYKNMPVTLVEYKIKTGRKHQIRCQSAIHKHPLLGDTAYGGKRKDNFGKDNFGKDDAAGMEFVLRAVELEFPSDNPLGLPQKIRANLTPQIIDILKCCEIENPGL